MPRLDERVKNLERKADVEPLVFIVSYEGRGEPERYYETRTEHWTVKWPVYEDEDKEANDDD